MEEVNVFTPLTSCGIQEENECLFAQNNEQATFPRQKHVHKKPFALQLFRFFLPALMSTKGALS